MYCRVAIALLGLLLAGCGSSAEQLDQPVSVKGRVTISGKPAKGYALTLQPLEDGHLTVLDLGTDGAFSGEAVPGKYAYYVVAGKSKADGRSQVDAKFLQADMARTLTIASGQDLAITLD